MNSVAAFVRPRRRSRSTGLLSQIVATLIDWQERANQRHALASLSDAALRDLGLSRADVETEVSKPFWRT